MRLAPPARPVLAPLSPAPSEIPAFTESGQSARSIAECSEYVRLKIVEEIGLDDGVTALNVLHCFAGERAEGKQIARLFFARPCRSIRLIDRD
jgi:hypothetical protein